MSAITTATLKVPGANLYYEVTGSGPVLLMIPGAPADAGTFAPIAAELAGRYTVVTYDWRGSSRSPVDEPPGDLPDGMPMQVQGGDAADLLAAVAEGPDYVLGCSGGAPGPRALVARHPGVAPTARRGRPRTVPTPTAADARCARPRRRRGRLKVVIPTCPARASRPRHDPINHCRGPARRPAVRGRRARPARRRAATPDAG